MVRPKKVYFAGKVNHGGGYRGKLLGNPRVMSDGYKTYHIGNYAIDYHGAFAISCDHGCFHGDGDHGWGFGNVDYECGQFVDELSNGASVKWDVATTKPHEDGVYVNGYFSSREDLVKRCFNQIQTCDAVHAYIDSFDCYGTLVELGYAAALNKPTYIVLAPNVSQDVSILEKDELWFVKHTPNIKSIKYDGGETFIHTDLLVPSSVEESPSAFRSRLKF
ncbi:MAG: hypothetical protein CLLPBCKN_001373 [Chroococcidiopsis cubana SAG 39.79]|uniref:Uncharacterized protein n=1 Tax=Chroococcidiopsis cubana SAG 39.79 TaxID=388085 RepID=A0AB37UDR1_9CYAN|nr:nucleoside 2-deoxyribosyltransferase [Chroococcidiopsis cubana]MDZ4871985.1 hypothetical protein [Chroococcidiopsis cubana SAG 39.79]PSB57197.1 hypothetical protein C7B79_31270 [Chroococcidiopsis cubana CCALA 043]RUT06351.1 hypothetical protein DSM107010_52960 [Chroococcidiopsis cubana SAG 39.79]